MYEFIYTSTALWTQGYRNTYYSVISTGLDYNVTSLNVTMGAGETRAMFNVGIIYNPVVERRESIQCTVSKIYTPPQVLPIEWDQVPATVIFDEYVTSVFLGNYSSVVSEDVSHVPITIESYSIATFEYTIDLHVDNDGTAKGMLQSPAYKALHLVYLSTSVFHPSTKEYVYNLRTFLSRATVLMINHSFVRSTLCHYNLLLSCLAIIAWLLHCNTVECCLLTL